MPEASPKIERDKIRHRRPNDLLFDDQQAPDDRRALLTDDVDIHDRAGETGEYAHPTSDYEEQAYEDGGEEDWTDQGEVAEEAADWDYEPEGDWVLDGENEPTDRSSAEDVVDDGEDAGVVWEDEVYDDQDVHDYPDEMTFGDEVDGGGLSAAPEVELAGRRDVRPKPPRPGPPPGGRAGGRPASRMRPPDRPARQGRGSRPPMDDIAASSEEVEFGPPPRDPRPAPAAAPSARSGRFSRTRAMLGVPEDDGSEQVLQPTRRSPPKRRRQPPAPSRARPRLDQPFAARNVRGGHRALIAIAVAAVIAAGGWLAFQSIGPDGFRPMIDRLTALVSLPGSTRTAEDSSFGDREDGVSPEQAVSNLETRARQETGGADGPPIPKFKPLPGATRSLSAGSDDPAQLAANGGEDDSGEPSIFEQLWRYLSPG